jgi:hypothetical protein
MRSHRSNMAESVNSTAAWRAVFWTTFSLGNVALALFWLLGQVPSPRHRDVRPYAIFWSCIAVLMLGSILVARKIWKGKKAGQWREVVQAIAWVELAVALCAVVALVFFRH